jgi:hypothetical protein
MCHGTAAIESTSATKNSRRTAVEMHCASAAERALATPVRARHGQLVCRRHVNGNVHEKRKGRRTRDITTRTTGRADAGCMDPAVVRREQQLEQTMHTVVEAEGVGVRAHDSKHYRQQLQIVGSE